MKWVNLTVAVIAGLCGFALARGLGGNGGLERGKESAASPKLSALPDSIDVPGSFSAALAQRGAAQVPAFYSAVGEVTTSAGMENLARRLLSSQANAASDSLWRLLLARWSEIDPAAMVAFVETEPPGHQQLVPKLQRLAFEAWGGVDPDAAFAAVRDKTKPLRDAALIGMAKRFPARAVELALKMPDAQFSIRPVVKTADLPEETLRSLLARSVYDGSRGAVLNQLIERLVVSDPAAALELSRSGPNYRGTESDTLGKIARVNHRAAIDLLDTLPLSRARAMSAVRIAGAWSAQDQAAALDWARGSLQGPVRGAALVEVAATVGGRDPLAGLALIEEAGWGKVRNFFEPVTVGEDGNFSTQQNFDGNQTLAVAKSLLAQLSASDPDAAHQFVARADESMREELAKVIAQEGEGETP